ncbi:MAG: SdpI family protein [Acidimicrobiia bacterium]|nr:SdpI family protein [Acidimicrobiia bacterium]
MIAQEDPIGWTAALILMVTVSLVMVAVGWLVIVIAERAADGRLGSNGLAGIRTRATRSSDEAWRAAHQVAERPTALAGWTTMASGVAGLCLALVFADGDAERATSIWSVAITVGGTLLLILSGFGAWKGHAAAKRVQQQRSGASEG